jgi:hypothetical protein
VGTAALRVTWPSKLELSISDPPRSCQLFGRSKRTISLVAAGPAVNFIRYREPTPSGRPVRFSTRVILMFHCGSFVGSLA